MKDTRLKILTIIILSVALSVTTIIDIHVVITLTIIYSCFFRNQLLKSIPVVLSTIFFIGMIGIFTFLFSSGIDLNKIILGSIKWISLILVTFIIFTSMNLFELLAGLVFFKINSKIAIAFGVGLRFLPIVIDEGKRIVLIQKRKQISEGGKTTTTFSKILSPLIVSIIRRIDTITLSILTQQIETRIKQYRFDSISVRDWFIFALAIVFTLVIFFNHIVN